MAYIFGLAGIVGLYRADVIGAMSKSLGNGFGRWVGSKIDMVLLNPQDVCVGLFEQVLQPLCFHIVVSPQMNTIQVERHHSNSIWILVMQL